MSRFRRDPLREEGFTLVELLVSMLLLTAVLGVFTASFIDIEKGVRKSNSLATAQNQARVAFQLLDRQVRYANAMNDPALSNGSQYLEFELGDVGTNNAGANIPQTCYQWRATNTNQLQWRSFVVASQTAAVGSYTSLTAWATVATGLNPSTMVFATSTNSDADLAVRAADEAVFATLEPAGITAIKRQLAVTLRITDGANPGGTASDQSLFTAANTTTPTAPGVTVPVGSPAVAAVCQQAGRP